MKKSIICALLVCSALNAVAQTNNPNRDNRGPRDERPNRDDRREDRRNDRRDDRRDERRNERDLNECPRPGLIDSKFMGETGEEMSMSHQRVGTPDISPNFTVTGLIRSRIFANHIDRICAEKQYIESQNVCEAIPVELAMGRGNALLASLFDMNITILKRAEAFLRTVRFSEGRSSAERLDTSIQIITQLTRAASVKGIPKSMMELTAMLKQAVNEGYLTYSTVEDITVTYRTANEQSLGYLPLEGSTVMQGRGNGLLNTLFDLGLSSSARAYRIQGLIHGVSASDSVNLSSAFINFAATNGIPATWDQFVMMMRSAVSSRAITERTLQMVTVDNETFNRKEMGFELSAELCRLMDITRTKNVIEIRNRRDFVRNSSKGYEINLAQAPLLSNEKEGMILTTDGLRNLDLKISSSYNRYQVQGTEVGGIMRFNVVGSRLAVKPENELKVKFNKMGDNSLHVRIQNRGFNPKVGGKVIVKVKFINGKLFDDKVLGTETYELDGSTELVKIAAFKHKDVDFVKVSLQIVGSPYFGEEFSESVKAKD